MTDTLRLRANDLFAHALGESSRIEFDAWYGDDTREWGLRQWERDVLRVLGRPTTGYPEVPGWLPQLREGPDYERDDMWCDDR